MLVQQLEDRLDQLEQAIRTHQTHTVEQLYDELKMIDFDRISPELGDRFEELIYGASYILYKRK